MHWFYPSQVKARIRLVAVPRYSSGGRQLATIAVLEWAISLRCRGAQVRISCPVRCPTPVALGRCAIR